MTQQTFSVLEKDNRALNDSRLYTLRESVQKQMDTIIHLYILSSEDKLLTRIGSDFSPTEALRIVSKLHGYKTINSYFNEILFIPYKTSRLYSTSGIYNKSDYTARNNPDSSMGSADFYSILENVKLMEIIPDYSGDIAFILPFSFTGSSVGTLMFLLSSDAVTGHMERIISNDFTASAIFDQEGRIISSFNLPVKAGDISFISEIDRDMDKGSRTIEIDGKRYLVSWINSPEFDWTYTVLTLEDVVMRSSRSIGRLVIIAVLTIMLAELILIIYLLKQNYYPIRDLRIQAEDKLGLKLTSENELSAMMTAVDIMSEEKKLSIPARREFLLFNTLKGRISTIEEFNLKGSEIGISFSHRVYTVAVLHFSELSQNERTLVFSWISTLDEPDIDVYVKDPLKELNFIFIISLDSYEQLEERIRFFKLELNRKFNLDCAVGVGCGYENFKSISKSYLEASTALDYCLVKGYGSIIYFNDIIKEQSDIQWYSKEDIKALYYSIKRGDQDSIVSIIKQLLDFINESSCPIFVAKSLAYDILYTVLNTIEEIGYSNTLPFYPDGIVLDHFESIHDLSNMLLDLCSDTCKLLKEKKKDEDSNAFPELKEQLLAYIEENYLEPDFYAQSMADNFSISISYLSQYFKSAVGENLKDYVYRLKIRKTKELLADTDLPVKEIVRMVGYQNASSFCRKFKIFTGKSPMEYRTANRKV